MKVLRVQMVKKLRGRDSLPWLHTEITQRAFLKMQVHRPYIPEIWILIGLSCVLDINKYCCCVVFFVLFLKAPLPHDLNVPSWLGTIRLKN